MTPVGGGGWAGLWGFVWLLLAGLLVLVPSGPVGGQSAPLAVVEFAGVYTDLGAYTPDVRSSVSHVEGAS
ncbi:MAG: hypothetical protein OXF75_05710, partial [Acidimicrobiaceae bacterium]|nr:hypothetical protein [Acidimicrobiaceae bacterium]